MKVDVDKFNMAKGSLILDLKLARTVVLELGHFFAIFVFPAYRKASKPTTNAPAHRPQKMIHSTLWWINIVMNTIYINFFHGLHLILDRAKNFVVGYIFNQCETISAPSKM